MRLFSVIAIVTSIFGILASAHAQTSSRLNTTPAASPSAPTGATKSSVPLRVGQTIFAAQRCPKGEGITFTVSSINEAEGTATGPVHVECWGKTGFAFNNKYWGKLKFSGDTVVFTMIDNATMQERLPGGLAGQVVRDGPLALDFGKATFSTVAILPTSLSLVFRDQGAQQAKH